MQNNQKADDFYGLRTAVIPDTVTSIGKNAFSKCYNLVLTDEKGMGSTFGLSVQTIGDYAFDNCVAGGDHFPIQPDNHR